MAEPHFAAEQPRPQNLGATRSTAEPFDFLTWFEFRPEDEPAFDHLLAELRRSPEWTYVDREIDVRLLRI